MLPIQNKFSGSFRLFHHPKQSHLSRGWLIVFHATQILTQEKLRQVISKKQKTQSSADNRYLCCMDDLLKDWQTKALKKQKETKQFLEKLQHKKGKGVEKYLPDLHEEAFSHIDCLQCAHCCKTISPRFKTPDIKRISKHLGMKESVFIETYLRTDEDGDYVVKSLPCPFLGSDNFCSIYEVRPGDCRNYPYTDSDQFIKRPNTTYQNSTICPAVYYVLEKLKEKV